MLLLPRHRAQNPPPRSPPPNIYLSSSFFPPPKLKSLNCFSLSSEGRCSSLILAAAYHSLCQEVHRGREAACHSIRGGCPRQIMGSFHLQFFSSANRLAESELSAHRNRCEIFPRPFKSYSEPRNPFPSLPIQHSHEAAEGTRIKGWRRRGEGGERRRPRCKEAFLPSPRHLNCSLYSSSY